MIHRHLHFQRDTKFLLITLCCVFHWWALFVAYFPSESPLKETLFTPLRGYLGFLGYKPLPPFSPITQYPQDIRLVIEAKYRTTPIIEQFSPMIPDFSGDRDNHLASLVFLQLVSLPQDSLETSTYAMQICKNLKRLHGSSFENVTLRFDRKLLRTLEEMRSDGVFTYSEITEKGPYPCS